MDGTEAQPLRCRKIRSAGLRGQIHDQASGPQGRQHRLCQHRCRDRVHHPVKGRGQCAQPGQLRAAQAKALGQSPLFRTPGADGHIRSQRCQPYPQRLPHRAKAQQQDVCAPQGAGALPQQDADAPFRRGDGIVDGQLRPRVVIHQLHARFLRDGLCLRREPAAQRHRAGLCGTQQLGQRGAALVQRERQQDAVCPRHLFGSAHRTARPFQRPACRRLPGIGAHDRKPLCLHAFLPSRCVVRHPMQEDGNT